MSAQTMVGPRLWLTLIPARDEPARIGELMRSPEAAAELAVLDPAERDQAMVNALTTLLIEPVYWRGFADTMERAESANRRALLRETEPIVERWVTEIYDTRVHGDDLRADQQHHLRRTNNVFDAALKDVYRSRHAPPLEDPRHPYNPILRAIEDTVAASPTLGERSVEVRLAMMARQQFYNTMFAAETIIGPWGALDAATIAANPGAREARSVADLATAVAHNFPRMLQLMRVTPGGLDAIMMGVLNGGVRGLIEQKLGADSAAEYDRAWHARQQVDFPVDLSAIDAWERLSGSTVPTVKLALMPTRAQRNAGADPSGIPIGSKSRCPAPEALEVPAALGSVGQVGDTEWARNALDKLRRLQRRRLLSSMGSPRDAETTSIAEIVLHTTLGHLGRLVAGRTSGTGRVFADRRSLHLPVGPLSQALRGGVGARAIGSPRPSAASARRGLSPADFARHAGVHSA